MTWRLVDWPKVLTQGPKGTVTWGDHMAPIVFDPDIPDENKLYFVGRPAVTKNLSLDEVRAAVGRLERALADDEVVVWCHDDDLPAVEEAVGRLRAESYRIVAKENAMLTPGTCVAVRATRLGLPIASDEWFR